MLEGLKISKLSDGAKKLITSLIVIAAFVALLLLVFVFYNRSKEFEKSLARMSLNYHLLKGSIATVKNRAGEATGRVEAIQLYSKEVDKFDSALNKNIHKFVKKPSELYSYTDIKSEAKGSIITIHDSVFITDTKGKKVDSIPINYVDSFLTVKGFTNGTLTNLRYKYKSEVEVVYHWTPQGIFKPPKLVVDVTPKDTNQKITSIVALNILPPKKKFYEKPVFIFGTGFTLGLGSLLYLMIHSGKL